MADSGIFTNIFTLIDESILRVIISKSGSFISVIEPLLVSGFTVYLLFLFMSYWNGRIDETAIDFAKKCLVWVIVLTFTFNIDTYNEYIPPIVMGFGDYLSQKLSGADTTINGSLDELLNIVIDGVGATMEKASGIMGTVLAVSVVLLIVVASLIFLVISAGYILLAKVFAGILVVVGPFFVGTALFPATRQFFHSWVNQAVNYILLTFFLNVLMAFFIEFMVSSFGTGAIDLSRGFNIAVGSGIFFVVLLRLPELASNLSGGLSANGFSQATRIATNVTSYAKGGKSSSKGKAENSVSKA